MAKSPFTTVAPMDHMVRTAPLYNGFDEAATEPCSLSVEAVTPPAAEEAATLRKNLLARQLTMG